MARRVMDIESKKWYAQQTFKWCKKFLGTNLRKKKPIKLSLIKQDKDNFGSYDAEKNKIIIYHENCLTVKDIVSTVIHEYTHYLQSNKGYFMFMEYYDYNSHPFEQEARVNEQKYTNRCVRYIRRYLL
jgi:Zn-dependent peptidase ImmA (M78 family)